MTTTTTTTTTMFTSVVIALVVVSAMIIALDAWHLRSAPRWWVALLVAPLAAMIMVFSVLLLWLAVLASLSSL